MDIQDMHASLIAIGTLADRFPIGTELSVEHDGFSGTVQGYYVTREKKPGLVVQLHDTKVVHVYSTKWFEAISQ